MKKSSLLFFLVLALQNIYFVNSVSCYQNCKTCLTTDTCSACQNGFFLINKKECRPCPQQCRTCEIGATGLPACLTCKDGSIANATKICECFSVCQTCSSLPTNCTSCKGGLKLTLVENNTYTCVQETTCNGIPHCTACLTANQMAASNSSSVSGANIAMMANSGNQQICNSCQRGFFSFRRGCEPCAKNCLSCSFNYTSIWEEVRLFWNTTRAQILSKLNSSTSAKRLLQSSPPGQKYSESYSNWTLTQWNSVASKWTTRVLYPITNMTLSELKGWVEAYFFFQATLSNGANMTNYVYSSLNIVQQLLNLTYNQERQWQHLARFVSKVTNKKWNSVTLNKKISQMAASRTVCSSCSKGYQMPSLPLLACSKCSNNCETCSTSLTGATYCTKCQSGYFLVSSGLCQKCTQNCKQCSVMNNNCTICAQFRSAIRPLPDNGACALCFPPCKFCQPTNGAKCVTCQSQYSYYANSDGGCYTCKDSMGCRQCQVANTSKCLNCRNGYYLNTTSYLCTSCPSNCLTCSISSNNIICYRCMKGYSLLNNVCSKCLNGCQSCFDRNASLCKTCPIGQFVDYRLNKCSNCPKGCAKCSGEDVSSCQKFQDGLVIFSGSVVPCQIGCLTCDSTNPDICLNCSYKYFLSNGKCLKCGQGCFYCLNQKNCLQCLESSNLVNGVCKSCSSNCRSCSNTNSSFCYSCARGLTLYKDGRCVRDCGKGCIECNPTTKTVCLKCDRGFTLASNGKCIKCLGQCSGTCNSRNITQCLSCIQGSYLRDNKCVICPQGCSSCQNELCSACASGFKLDQVTKLCVLSCLYPCSTCSLSQNMTNECLSCLDGYQLENGSCNVNLSCNSVGCGICLPGSQMNTVTLQCLKCPNKCSNCQNGICLTCFDGFFLNTTTKTCSNCQSNCLSCLQYGICNVCAPGFVFQILEILPNSQIRFGRNCVPCNTSCRTCSIYPFKCTSCRTGFRLENEKCVGQYAVKYNIQLDYNDTTFLINGQSQNFIGSLSKRLMISQQKTMLSWIKKGSTIITGTISADNQTQAQTLQSTLSQSTQLDGYKLLSSSVETVFSNNSQISSITSTNMTASNVNSNSSVTISNNTSINTFINSNSTANTNINTNTNTDAGTDSSSGTSNQTVDPASTASNGAQTAVAIILTIIIVGAIIAVAACWWMKNKQLAGSNTLQTSRLFKQEQ